MRDLTAAMAQILAENIRTLRLSRGENQTEFGEAVEVSQGTVARWEKGAGPKHGPLVKMAAMANVSVADFTNRLLTSLDDQAGANVRQSAQVQTLYLPVSLPSESDLSQMFEGLLGTMPKERDPKILARKLAQLLPSALGQTVSRSIARLTIEATERTPSEAAQDPSTDTPPQQL